MFSGVPPSHRASKPSPTCVQAISGGELVLGDLRMPGLDLANIACSAAQSDAAGVPIATALLCVSVDGMPPQELRVRVRPGPPACMELQAGHPWAEVIPAPQESQLCIDKTFHVELPSTTLAKMAHPEILSIQARESHH